MLNIILHGVLLGFTLAIFIGPAFFTLIQTSIHRGFRSAMLLAIGILLSDTTLILLIYFGVSQIIYKEENKFAFGFVGGVILVLFGIFTYLRKVHIVEDENDVYVKTPGPLTFILKGYFLNIANPSIWIFWITIMGIVTSNYGFEHKYVISFYSGTLGIVFFTDLVKSFIANKIKQRLTPKFMTIVNRVVGIILAVFGLILIWQAIPWRFGFWILGIRF